MAFMKYFALENGCEKYLRSAGIDVAEVLKTAALPETFWQSPNKVINEDEWWSLNSAIWAQLTTPERLVAFVNNYNIRCISKLFVMTCSCSDGLVFLERFCQYHSLVSPYNVEYFDLGTQCEVQWSNPFSTVRYQDSIDSFEAMLITNILREYTQQKIKPVSLELCGRFAGTRTIAAFFGCQTKLAEKVRLCFEKSDLTRPFLNLQEKLWGFLEPKIVEEINYCNGRDSWTAKVNSILLGSFVKDELNINSVGCKLGVNVRTLQRQLADENTCFKKMLQEMRIKKAKFYLKYTHLKINEIAFYLGYEECHSFIKAFRSYTGMTCNEYRNSKVL